MLSNQFLTGINKTVKLMAGKNEVKVDVSIIYHIINRKCQQLKHCPDYIDTHAKRVIDNLLSELLTEKLDLYILISSTEKEKAHLYSVLDPSNNDMANQLDIFDKKIKIELIAAIIETLFPKKKQAEIIDSNSSKEEGALYVGQSFSFITNKELRKYGVTKWTRLKKDGLENVVLVLQMANKQEVSHNRLNRLEFH